MNRKPKNFTIEKKVYVSPELAEQMKAEFERNPHLYRNEQNQLSENVLTRRALEFFLSHLSDSSIEQRNAA